MEIVANKIYKEIDSKIILKDVTLSIKSGSIYGLIGPNGAGKTTFSRLIMNIYTPTSGTITVNGIDTTSDDFEKIKPYISCVMDNLGLYKDLTVSENVEFFHRIYFPKASNIERSNSIKKSLEIFGLQDKQNSKINFLSKGERQRLALARACLNRPKLIILDEPTIGLDVQGVLLVRRYIQELKRQGTTVLINSHNLSELEKICDYYGFINKGNIIEQGNFDELVEKYSQKLGTNNLSLEDIYKVIFNVEE